MGVSSPQWSQRRGLRSDKEQREVVWPEFIHHSATEFRTPQHMYTNIRKEILQTNSSAEIAYYSVPPDWGTLIVDSIENHEDTERSNASINYNSVTGTLLIRIMPTRVHECHTNWMRQVEREWRRQNLVTDGQLNNLTVFTNAVQEHFAAPYTNSRKSPDFCMTPDNQYQPSFVIEIGWSESQGRLVQDMQLWMTGGRPHVKIVLILEFAKRARTNQVTGKAELYVRDAAGNPFCHKEAVIFPANVTGISLWINAGDLFGHVLPQGLAANTALPLSIDPLREEARKALVHMGMVPAT
ncbi:uncharacterized protein CDV56_107388 [Aspergillus thermomutatus]|uniref:Restriction endonuclease domain-containing protein n=1 Tax=Aspergillus thermomutatus TaxID=41047 RepID=A0A397HV11_ASPTH|nr:uncharacterized protein CDV56_107388 [Aspergillus thermomutatus]RHZ65828.1 hypothetical protein CDV56_107388 [Aspergillus thermomutatus]